ncbi:hypothetical protein SteCoe_29458 [Stentor coeruleus]|uniref:LITAF domain-containing protein n=1 Tax=Stentor coeruleus TaxID=5963 RepID=A0A1R2B600_9CILI|nr:hypothetical protein SteCoe_29458 [Stentor coeruleus]
MSNSSPDHFFSPAELTAVPSPQCFSGPELSEEPIFRGTKRSGTDKITKGQEPHMSSELNSSSLQVSTQQSLNFKRSFTMTSPKRSVPSTPFLLANKLKEIQGQSLTLRLNEKLKELEDDSNVRKTQEVEIEPLSINEDFRYPSYPQPALENRLALEGENDSEIPQLRWCAACKGEVKTETEYVNSRKTFWASVGIFMSGGVLGCFLLPYMTNSCKGIRVVCHKCRRALA